MSAPTTLHRIEDILIDHLGITRENIQPEHDIFTDLGADSLDGVEIVMAVEEEFELEITDESAEKLTTVAHFVEYVDNELRHR